MQAWSTITHNTPSTASTFEMLCTALAGLGSIYACQRDTVVLSFAQRNVPLYVKAE